MPRILCVLSAFAASCAVVSGTAAATYNEPAPVAPAMIGADNPVFLGRMVVSATPLPEESRR